MRGKDAVEAAAFFLFQQIAGCACTAGILGYSKSR